jgi:hypothetical protein
MTYLEKIMTNYLKVVNGQNQVNRFQNGKQ